MLINFPGTLESLLAKPCFEPAIAPGTRQFDKELAMRPVPAGLAGF